jgi:hypothetical protein
MDIRVRNKVFATFPADGRVAMLRCTPENLDKMIKEKPDAFSKGRGETWMEVALDLIDRAMLRTLLIESWLQAAPQSLRQMHEAQLASRVR